MLCSSAGGVCPIIPIRFGHYFQNNNRRSGIKIWGSSRTPSVNVTENRYSVLGGGGGTCLAFVRSSSGTRERTFHA